MGEAEEERQQPRLNLPTTPADKRYAFVSSAGVGGGGGGGEQIALSRLSVAALGEDSVAWDIFRPNVTIAEWAVLVHVPFTDQLDIVAHAKSTRARTSWG